MSRGELALRAKAIVEPGRIQSRHAFGMGERCRDETRPGATTTRAAREQVATQKELAVKLGEIEKK